MSNNHPKKKRLMPGEADSSRWSDREMLDFTIALQQYGFADTKKITVAVKTKSENAVKALIKLQVGKVRRQLFKRRGRKSNFLNVKQGSETQEWPAVRKWQKIAQNQMMDCIQKVDYSRMLMRSICERFHNEAEEPTDAQLVNIKAIYGYLVECVSGHVPPELPPKESAIVLMLMRLIREMGNEMDMQEEKAFITNFKKATTFVPFQLKGEFRKMAKSASAPVLADTDTVPIPEEVYCELSRHRKVVQSFNPLTIPLWLLMKEQDFLARMFDTPPPPSPSS